MDMMTSAVPIAAILGAADINDAHDYYHYSDGPNFARDYFGNHPRSYCARL
jgi:hypothetical protein